MKYINTPLETSSQHKQSATLILRIKSTIFAILKCQEIAHPLSFLALILLLLPAMEDGRAVNASAPSSNINETININDQNKIHDASQIE